MASMHRRRVLQSLVAAPLAAAAPPPEIAALKVTGLEMFRVKVNRRGDWLLVRLQTSAGLTGIGDASHGRDETTEGLLRRLFDKLKGRGIFDIEWLRREAQPLIRERGASAAVALSGLEQCLWDIRGKAFGVPVYELFGGRLHARIRNYANINRSTDPRTPEGFAQMAARAVAAGFDAVKLAPFDEMPRNLTNAAKIEEFTQRGIDCAKAVRQAIGPQLDLLIDAHSHFDRAHGLELARRFEPLNLFWLEEVTPARPLDDLAAINRAAKMPTAGGESIYGVQGFYPYVAAGAVDIIMPDIKACGGLLEMKKIAALGEGAGLLVAPHGPASPVGNIAAAHVCAGMPNFHILEFSYGEVPWRAGLIDPPEAIAKGGFIELSGRPGFGVELNLRLIREHQAA